MTLWGQSQALFPRQSPWWPGRPPSCPLRDPVIVPVLDNSTSTSLPMPSSSHVLFMTIQLGWAWLHPLPTDRGLSFKYPPDADSNLVQDLGQTWASVLGCVRPARNQQKQTPCYPSQAAGPLRQESTMTTAAGFKVVVPD